MKWFWSSPEWAAYCAAYPQPIVVNYGLLGNLLIPLRAPDDMWQGIRKGHRADIVYAKRLLRVLLVPDAEAATNRDFVFGDYRSLHRLANGIVRGEGTFEAQASWLGKSLGLVAVAYDGSNPCAAGYFIRYRRRAYYASGPRFGDVRGAAALVLWTAMRKLVELGDEWLDMGPIPDEHASAKERSIFAFKKGFGGEIMNVRLLDGGRNG